MLVIYGGSLSPYTMRILLQLRAKGLEYEQRGAPGGDSKAPEYLALNPMGRYPTLQHDDFILPESAVIAEYLEEAFPTPGLLLVDVRQRALVRLIVRIVDLYFTRSIHPLYNQSRLRTPDESVVSVSLDGLSAAYKYLDRYIGAGRYAVGNTLTLADCALLPYIFVSSLVLPLFGWSAIPDAANLRAWWVANEGTPEAETVASEMMVALKNLRPRGARGREL